MRTIGAKTENGWLNFSKSAITEFSPESVKITDEKDKNHHCLYYETGASASKSTSWKNSTLFLPSRCNYLIINKLHFLRGQIGLV